MAIIRDEKTAAAARTAERARTTEIYRRFIRDARPAARSYGSGAFWYPIWRNLRRA